MANNSGHTKSLKWSAVGLVIAIVVVAIIAYEANSLLTSKISSNQLPATPNPTEEVTATLTPTEALTPNPTRIPVHVDFTYKPGSQYSFTLTVDVDLNDGMNQEEALTVAKTLIDHELNDVSYSVKSAKGNETYWMVNFSWEMSSIVGLPSGEVRTNSDLGHFFNVCIQQTDLTIDYVRCT